MVLLSDEDARNLDPDKKYSPVSLASGQVALVDTSPKDKSRSPFKEGAKRILLPIAHATAGSLFAVLLQELERRLPK
jgi:hypothetical protein